MVVEWFLENLPWIFAAIGLFIGLFIFSVDVQTNNYFLTCFFNGMKRTLGVILIPLLSLLFGVLGWLVKNWLRPNE